jgi:hypothetical protein
MSRLTTKLPVIVVLALFLIGCSFARVDNRKFILGSWEGNFQRKREMYVTFHDDGTAVVDYTPDGGGKAKVHYKFKDDKTFAMDNYPEGAIVE